MADTLGGIAGGAVAGFVVGYALKYVGPKSKLVMWFPHNFLFQVPGQAGQPPVTILTNSVSVQNIGRKRATNVEVVHAAALDHFKLFPSRDYTEHATSAGEHIISINSLGPGEWFTIELLSYRTIPNLLYVRSDDGPAQSENVVLMRPWPTWRRALYGLLCLTGAGYCIYWILRGALLAARALGFTQ